MDQRTKKQGPCYLGLQVSGEREGLARITSFHHVGDTASLPVPFGLPRYFALIGKRGLEGRPHPTSDEALIEVATHFRIMTRGSKLPGGILVTDSPSARILKRLHPDTIRACQAALTTPGVDLTWGYPTVRQDGTSFCFVVSAATNNLVVAVRRPMGDAEGRLDVLAVQDIVDPDQKWDAIRSDSVHLRPARVIHEYSGPLPARWAKDLIKVPGKSAHKGLARLRDRFEERFWDEFSPSLERPFVPERTQRCIHDVESGEFMTVIVDPIDRRFSASRGSADEVRRILQALAQICFEEWKARSGADAASIFIELKETPQFASTILIRDGIKTAMKAIIAWSGLAGTEVRGYAGDRAGTEIMGPAFLQIDCHEAVSTGHETLERIGDAMEFLASNGIMPADEAGRLILPS